MDQPRRVNLHFEETSVFCKAGCGFYGNPVWQNYCSVCHKKYKNQAKLAQLTASPNYSRKSTEFDDYDGHASSPRRSPTSVPSSPSPISSKHFEKFEEKKQRQSSQRSKTLKSIFKRGTSTFSDKASPSSLVSSTLPLNWKETSKLLQADAQSWTSEDGDSLRFNPIAAFSDIRKQTQKMIDKLNKMNQVGYYPPPRDCATVEEMSESVHDFYQYMSDRFEKHPIYSGATGDQVEQLIDMCESYLMDQMYHVLTSRIQTEDEAIDLALQKRIKSLNWIMVDMRNPLVRDLLDKAITEIIEMGSKCVPAEKLATVVSCAKSICKLLQVANDKPINADQFLPGLIFVVIKANPPLLHSNIKFVTRFSNPRRLMSGEAGYYFTNLCCATSFIEKLSADNLNMPEDEFAKYINGEALPPGAFEQSAYLCEAFRVMYSNMALLNDLTERQRRFETEVNELREKMVAFKEDIARRLEPALDKSKHKPLHYTVADDVDLKLIPSFLRSRVLKERTERAALNSVLVDVNGDQNKEAVNDTKESNGSSEANENGNAKTESNQQSKLLLESSPERDESLPAPLQPEIVSPSPSPLPK